MCYETIFHIECVIRLFSISSVLYWLVVDVSEPLLPSNTLSFSEDLLSKLSFSDPILVLHCCQAKKETGRLIMLVLPFPHQNMSYWIVLTISNLSISCYTSFLLFKFSNETLSKFPEEVHPVGFPSQ